ncbi:MAG: S9 family peptidase [Saprospiraceae bacterium]|nr:S9 family peptidase [Saprospiraceae bacterium]
MNSSLPGDPSLVSPESTIEKLIETGSSEHDLPVELFFKLPEKANYQISRDGTYYAYLAPWKRRMNIFVEPLTGGTPIRITEVEDRSISGFSWVNNKDLVFLKDVDGDENYHLWVTDLQSHTARDLTPFDNVRAEIIDMLIEDDDHIIISLNKNNPQVFDPYRLNVKTGELNQLAENNHPESPIMAWLTDHQGRLRIAVQLVEGVTSVLLYRESEDEAFNEVLRTDYKTEVSPLFFDFNQDHIVWASSNLDRDKAALVKLNMRTGEEVGEVIFEHPVVDISSAGYSRVRRCPTMVTYITDKRHYHFLDEKRAKLQERIEREVPGMEAVIISASKDEKKGIIRAYSDISMGSYYAYDGDHDEIVKLSEVSPWLDNEKMSPQKAIQYRSRDGLTIHGYLTMPRDVTGPIPFVINPHGGPWHRDTWGFNPEVQLFASRGYGVLQINFRGSTGYGRDFWTAGFKEWGQSMQDDITDGVKWLIDQDLADADKIAIYGGSYGGYATLAGVCYTPDLYACAIDYVGVSNLFTFMETVPPYWEPYLKMMYEMVGHPEKDKEMMKAYSPALNADKIEVPLFVIQGAHDPRVNIDESDQIVRNLRSRGIDVPYMVKYDEGHGFHNEENKFEVYKAMMGFLAKHLS